MTRSALTALSIGGLSARTGVPPGTLRSWEERYGFPRPTRLAGGHRRYDERDVAAVVELMRLRESGVELGAAVRQVTSAASGARSVYAELRRHHPELSSQRLSKPTILALTRAIEDECCARAEEPLLFAGFQREHYVRQSRARWGQLARTARVAVVFADFAAPAEVEPGCPVEVALPGRSPLHREWFLVCESPDLPACLAGVERPGAEEASGARSFDTVWTVDPRLVRHASRVATALADQHRPGWRAGGLTPLTGDPAPASADLRRASTLLDRIMGYLDAGR